MTLYIFCEVILFSFVLFQHLKKRNRVKMVEYFIDVAKECINIGNFNSLMAIIGKIPTDH